MLDCNANCKHGGVCEGVLGHEGPHNSGYCQWESKDSISQEQADEIMRRKAYPEALIQLEAVLRDLNRDRAVPKN